MINRRRVTSAAAAAGILVLATLPQAASKNFAPDVVFKGSSLNGWKPLGQAEWRAQDGEITAVPKGGGWLVLDRAYQDVAFFSSFRCAPGCKTGVLICRNQPVPSAGRSPGCGSHGHPPFPLPSSLLASSCYPIADRAYNKGWHRSRLMEISR